MQIENPPGAEKNQGIALSPDGSILYAAYKTPGKLYATPTSAIEWMEIKDIIEMAAGMEASEYQFHLQELEDKTLILIEQIFRGIVSDLERGVGVESISSKFHNTIAKIILTMCLNILKTNGLDRVALSGGVFQNSLLLENTYVLLDKNNFKVFTQHRVPPNDGGIALGQVVVANERVKKG